MHKHSKDTLFPKNKYINLQGRLVSLDIPLVMGILNVTPDSFYDGGKYFERKTIGKRIQQIITEGADIIDLGASSSRPGSKPVSEAEELSRLRTAAEIFRKLYPDFPLCIDTFRAPIAGKMIEEYSACMVNDISAGELDHGMFDLISEKKIAYVMMHMKGTPENMQRSPEYKNVVNEIILYFAGKISNLKDKGIVDFIIDPGFGFGKTMEHNYQLLAGLDLLKILEAPVMAGLSRKSMIYKYLHSDSEGALNGTTALHMYALEKGADILRAHDVKEAREVVQLYLKLREVGQTLDKNNPFNK